MIKNYEIIFSRLRDRKYLLSIGIPTFNRREKLERTLNSLKILSNKEKFLIVISDNHSDMDNESLVRNFFTLELSFDYIYSKNIENIGAIENWNRLFELSLAPKTMMLFDDDVLTFDLSIFFDRKDFKKGVQFYFNHKVKYEKNLTLGYLIKLKVFIRNYLIKFARKEQILGFRSLIYTVPSFIGAILDTDLVKQLKFLSEEGPTADYYFTIELAKVTIIKKISLPIITYYHGENWSSDQSVNSNFPKMNFIYRISYLNYLYDNKLIKEKDFDTAIYNLVRIYITESKAKLNLLIYSNAKFFQINIILKQLLNII
jgi:GT2 family glycosyltransferase